MLKIVRPIAIFAVLYLASSWALSLVLPKLMTWHFGNCSAPSFVCSASAGALRYWWLALLPILGIATLLINWAFAKRHAA